MWLFLRVQQATEVSLVTNFSKHWLGWRDGENVIPWHFVLKVHLQFFYHLSVRIPTVNCIINKWETSFCIGHPIVFIKPKTTKYFVVSIKYNNMSFYFFLMTTCFGHLAIIRSSLKKLRLKYMAVQITLF